MSGVEVQRLLAGARPDRAVSLDEHLADYGATPDFGGDRERLIAIVDRSGLRGRGGADFPTAKKIQAVARHGRRRVVLANGVEGEPASAKDKLLLSAVPHLVIDGAQLAAQAVGASDAILCVMEGARQAVTSVEVALAERAERRLDSVRVQLAHVPNRYIVGEESALVHQLNGGPAKPTFIPPRPFERGVASRPTLVQNVETLAHLAQIARYGDDWFRDCGTVIDPGSALITISGAVERPGVYEIECGAAVRDMISLAGGASEAIQAFLIGGYFGTWFAAPDALDLHLGHGRMRAAGGSLGSGVVVALPASVCGLVESARVMRYLAEESSGQCGPCVYGLDAIARAVADIAHRRPSDAVSADLQRWSIEIVGRGACHHPDGAARFTRSALAVFADEIEAHAHGTCTASRPRQVLPTPPGQAAAV